METIKLITAVIGFILMVLGTIMIYDARKLTKKWFSFHDQNEGSKGFKIVGFVFDIIGILLVFLYL